MPGKFVTAVVKDIAPINKTDIVMFLPQPESVGGTKRVAACLHFDVQLEKYNCRPWAAENVRLTFEINSPK